MLKFFVLSLIFVSVISKPHSHIRLRRAQGALEFKNLDLYKFKGIPEFHPLKNGEIRKIFHYEQTIVVRDSREDDDKIQRCKVLEVYKKEEQKDVLSELKKLLSLNEIELLMDGMMDLLQDCDSVDNNIKQDPKPKPEPGATTPKPTNEENPLLNGIVPGTKWCGFGDIANSYHDLGRLRNVDRCCRAHDLCPIKVLSKDKVYNLTNSAIYTKSHCRCDGAFYDCLKKDNGWTAKIIGSLYFYVAHPACIEGVPENPEEGMTFVPATKKW